MKRSLNGILLLDKAAGISSNAALQKARWLYQAEKAGHGGTLDPFATGLLPLLFGEASKFGQYLLGADKGYVVTIRFGRETTTDDPEGDTLREAAIPDLAQQDWTNLLASLGGDYLQTPPIFSALKVHGKRAYELARRGEIPELAPRPVQLHALNLLAVHEEQIVLEVSCSKGTYIRALARDIGRLLDSAAYAEQLQRTAVGKLSLAQAHSLQTIETLAPETRDGLLLPISACLDDMARLAIPAAKIRFIRHGNDIETDADEGEYALYDEGDFFGIGRVAKGRLYPQRLCRLPDSDKERQ